MRFDAKLKLEVHVKKWKHLKLQLNFIKCTG